jgi:hypothetical protein
LKIHLTKKLEEEMERIRNRFCQDNKTVPCLIFAVVESDDPREDSNGELTFRLGTIERQVDPGLRAPLFFSQNEVEYALNAGEEIELLDELHLDFYNGRVINIG